MVEYFKVDVDGVYDVDSGATGKSYVNVVDPVDMILNLPL